MLDDIFRMLDDIARNPDGLILLIPVLLSLIPLCAGLGAVVAAGVWSRKQTRDDPSFHLPARVVAGIGGGVTAYLWFEWPMVTERTATYENCDSSDLIECLFNPTITEVTRFSVLALFGVGVFVVIGVALHHYIAFHARDTKAHE